MKKDLHILQLNSYRNDRYVAWILKNPSRALNVRNLIFFYSLFPLIIKDRKLAAWVFVGSYLTAFFLRTKEKEKKPLVLTFRAIRLYSLSLILLLFIYIILFFWIWHATILYLAFAFSTLILITFLSPLFLLLCNYVILPLETMINRYYYNYAKKKLRLMPLLKVIGITGSYGKTTTKHALYELLRKKYNTLMTSGSYNTPMGISKIIRAKLQPIHEIFLVEMSAKQKGDIKEICELVNPQFGLITSIGEQHLLTFGDLENVKKTKNELIESLPEIGLAFFNMDDIYCQQLSLLTKKKKIYYGTKAEKLHYRVEDIHINSDGSSFVICKEDGIRVNLQTRLLGRQNVYNILAAVAIASELGMKLNEMVYPLRQLNPVPHRLELKKLKDDIIYIDDAFNSNPIGSKMALEVLQQIPGKRKIIVTPGMVELGERENEINCKFGEDIAKVCHHVILVGKKQTLAIQEGLKHENFPLQSYYIAQDFNDANRHLQSILQTNDVVLFENDLPDNY